MPLVVFGYNLLLYVTFNVSFLKFHRIPKIFSVSFGIELISMLDLAISCWSKTSKVLEFEIHFVIVNPPFDDNLALSTVVVFFCCCKISTSVWS